MSDDMDYALLEQQEYWDDRDAALETIECVSCGNVTAPDGKCLTAECEQAAVQHAPRAQPNTSVVSEPGRITLFAPSAWTIRGGVD